MKHRKRLAALIAICLILNFSFGMVPMKVPVFTILHIRRNPGLRR